MIIDFVKLIKLLLPTFIRTATINMIITPIANYLSEIKSEFDKNKTSNIYQLAITPQVYAITRALNDRYDKTLRRIFISDGTYISALALYQDAEDLPVYIYTDAEDTPVYIYQDDEHGYDDSTSFIVNVPEIVIFNHDEMVAFIKSYCLPGRKFIIQTYA